MLSEWPRAKIIRIKMDAFCRFQRLVHSHLLGRNVFVFDLFSNLLTVALHDFALARFDVVEVGITGLFVLLVRVKVLAICRILTQAFHLSFVRWHVLSYF